MEQLFINRHDACHLHVLDSHSTQMLADLQLVSMQIASQLDVNGAIKAILRGAASSPASLSADQLCWSACRSPRSWM